MGNQFRLVMVINWVKWVKCIMMVVLCGCWSGDQQRTMRRPTTVRSYKFEMVSEMYHDGGDMWLLIRRPTTAKEATNNGETSNSVYPAHPSLSKLR